MKKALTITAIVLGGITVWGVVGYFGLRVLARAIYAQRTCGMFNIDNIEMHARVDIPDIEDFDCEYIEDLNTKLARFDIDKAEMDMDRYIRRNNFKKFNPANRSVLLDSLIVRKSKVYSLLVSDMYYTSGAYKGETWQSLLNNSTGTLWVVIRYQD